MPFSVLVSLLLNMVKRSLSIEIQSFFSWLGNPIGVSKSAFCQQRAKLKARFFEDWNKVLTNSYYKHYGEEVRLWKGYKILAVDGTTLSLPDTPTSREPYGCTANKHGSFGATARSSVLYDPLNNLVLSGTSDPYDTDERSTAVRLLKDMPESSLITLDRGYPCFRLAYIMTHIYMCKFVIRVKADVGKQVREFVDSSKSDTLIDMRATAKGINGLRKEGITANMQTTVPIRLVKVTLKNGEREILMTNPFDIDEYTYADLKEIYSLRWGIETFYGFAKNELQIESFSGTRPICIQQDFYATLFVYNLQSIIEKQSKEYIEVINKKRTRRYKINRNVSWAMLKYRITELFIGKRGTAEILKELQYLFERNLEPVRPGRSFPRIKKARKLNGKYVTFTNHKRSL
jgi:hypothetical protein